MLLSTWCSVSFTISLARDEGDWWFTYQENSLSTERHFESDVSLLILYFCKKSEVAQRLKSQLGVRFCIFQSLLSEGLTDYQAELLLDVIVCGSTSPLSTTKYPGLFVGLVGVTNEYFFFSNIDW